MAWQLFIPDKVFLEADANLLHQLDAMAEVHPEPIYSMNDDVHGGRVLWGPGAPPDFLAGHPILNPTRE